MVDQGRRILTAAVTGWYDCGKVDTLLETNQHLLETGRSLLPAGQHPGCTIHPPVRIEDGVQLRNAVIGPNVTIEPGTIVRDSTISNSILGAGVSVVNSTIADSVIGDRQVSEGRKVTGSVMDGGELAAAR